MLKGQTQSEEERTRRELLLQKCSGTANGNFGHDQRRRLRESAQCRSYKLKRARKIISYPATHAMPLHVRAGNSAAPQDRRGMSWSAGAQCVLERCRTPTLHWHCS
jgi:hypothetical protein